ncbi:MAG: hypothetical protein WCP34_11855 [Pseudomonadota bacterium]
MASCGYYTLATSLPFLPPLPQNKNLPLTRHNLEKRIQGMLAVEDLLLLRRYQSCVSFSRPSEESDAAYLRSIEAFMKTLPEDLRTNLGWFMDFRMATAAIRRRELGMPAPAESDGWWRGYVLAYLIRYWEEPSFRLERRFSFLPEYVASVRRGDMANAGRLLLEAAETELRRAGEDHEFSLTALIFYVLRFGLIERWIVQRDEQRATEAIHALIQKVITP